MADILLVEDDRHLAKAIALVLPSFGHDVRIAGDGDEALSEVSRAIPDAVILDIGLPSLDGLEVARLLRQICGAGLRLVAYTGRSDMTARDAANAGFDDLVLKPAPVERLLRAVAGLERRR